MVSTDAIAAMKAMAQDSKKRQMLVKDTTCMGGLVLVLSNPQQSVVTLALETLLLLGEEKELRPLIAAHIGMLDQLEMVLHRSQNGEEVKKLADQLYGLLTESPLPQAPLRDSSNTQLPRSSGTGKNKPSLKSTKSVVLQVRGVHDQADRDLCMRLLLRVKGVVSITFDVHKKQCLMRTKPEVKPESLVRAITKSMTMSAQQVIRNENGDESLVSFNVSCGFSTMEPGTQGKENETFLPPYLSDDEDEKNAPREEDRSALSKGGTERETTTSKWFSAAASFLTNSFYW
ncbi:armadillo repeat-containing protein 1-like [Littorina saxatilis]|uniref:Armadillo repeat-containing protein 1 n=1 Tax=Littorina saxatilis TaxID=31220 RepID=A0AAN9G976_9CAEN